MFIYIYRNLRKIGYAIVLIAISKASLALAAGPPQGADSAVWCEQNSDECSEWCAEHTEVDICQEPECD